MIALMLLVGCSPSPVDISAVPEHLHSRLAICEARPGDARDWCLYGVVARDEQITGDQVLVVCKALDSGAATDKCIERSVRSKTPPPSGTCDRIHDPTTRSSCWLLAADHEARSGTIEAVVAACERTGDMQPHCFGHIPMRRSRHWTESGGTRAMNEDIQALLAARPSLAQVGEFGDGVAIGVDKVGLYPGVEHPCSLLPPGPAHERCVAAP